MKRVQKQKNRQRTAANPAYARGMQQIRRSNAAGPHRSATDYERRAKHVKSQYDDQY